MKLTVLVDNNTYIDQYFLGEPAVSYYIEDGNERILFDTGYSDVFIRNAKKLHIDLSSIKSIKVCYLVSSPYNHIKPAVLYAYTRCRFF